MKNHNIYLDYAATTPLDQRVVAAMKPYVTGYFYNPSAAYAGARAVRRSIEAARTVVASILGAKPSEIIFTAGATESINLAILGILKSYPESKVVTSAIEHPAVLEAAKQAAACTIVPVQPDGQIDFVRLEQAIDDSTVLVSVGYVNSEIGTIQPLRKIAALCQSVRERRVKAGNDLPLYFHSDASQATGHLDLHVSRLGVTMMSLNAAKAYGPKQVGVLYAKAGTPLKAIIFGGGQENGLRSGTENVAGIIGMAEAFRLAEAARAIETRRLQALHSRALARLKRDLPEATINGRGKHIAPHILNISIAGVDGERLLIELDEAGVEVATGSACAANRDTRSHVLDALGLSSQRINGSLRLSFGRFTTEAELNTALTLLVELVKKQQACRV